MLFYQFKKEDFKDVFLPNEQDRLKNQDDLLPEFDEIGTPLNDI
ncbi:hypothetical protein [Neobacillus massiliamazoniensis]|jgi:hypothetical protein|uniref:Uncharacterized protein n=1 Tax=Neobacillus massiliamazoniensis TaxID=1499688 RepID=A0A0U1P0A3_9BACI|nr:hypothetical protein [Neobacillus massiliamazoniensis]CRK83651.1 hypothetical protein BN000_03641 [Neobacillus massiliamazoniensis]